MNKVEVIASGEPDAAGVWARLVSARDIAAARLPWLEMACLRLGDVGQALLFDRVGDADYRVTAVWPKAGAAQAELIGLAREATDERRGLVSLPDGGGAASGDACHLAYPIVIGDMVHGAVAVSLSRQANDQAAISEAMRSLQWSLAWLRDFLQQKVLGAPAAGGAKGGAASLALESIADMLGPVSFRAAAHTLAMRLVSRFGLERVAVGLVRRGSAAVAEISNSASFARRMNLVRLIEEAMDEAIDQERPILYPPDSDTGDTVRRAHAALAREVAGNAILTIPLLRDDRIVGALLCETGDNRSFSQPDIDALNAIVAFAGPILLLRREQDRNIVVKNAIALWHGLGCLAGPRHLAVKLATLAVTAALVAISLIRTEYQVTADASLEAAVQRAVVAPYDGYITEAPLRAGDTVKAGALIAALDDRKQALDALYWQSERQQRVLEYDKALAEADRQTLKTAQAQMEQAEVRLRMANTELDQARLHAPIGGVIVSGDLSQSIGAPVKRGDVLFQIAPLDAYRLVLDVDESQIGEVRPGMQGSFLSSSLPGQPMTFAVNKLIPVATAKDGRTVFRVEAGIAQDSGDLRPGMQGIGKIDAGEASLLWVWTRAFRNWARMAIWAWWP